MILRDTSRISKDISNTDTFINKVLPVQNFTQLMTVLRSVLDEEHQIEALQKLHEQFFSTGD